MSGPGVRAVLERYRSTEQGDNKVTTTAAVPLVRWSAIEKYVVSLVVEYVFMGKPSSKRIGMESNEATRE